MKFVISIILTAVAGFAMGLYLEWWSIAIAAFIVALFIKQSPVKAYFSGFLGLFLLWGGIALVMDISNQHILSRKIADLFSLDGSYILLILVTALTGAVVAGFAALTGSFVHRLRR